MDRNPAFFLLLVAAFLALGFLLALPLLQYLLFAVLLAYVLHPLQRRLTPRVGPRIAAGSLIVATVFVVLVPFGVLANVVIQQAVTLADAVRRGELNSEAIETYLSQTFGIEVDIEELLRSLFQNGQSGLVDNVVELLGGLTDILIGLTVVLFALYYLLVDGDDFVTWLRDLAPIDAGVQDELTARINRIMWAVFVVNVLVAIVQGVLTGIGFVIVGIPNVVFWTVMTVVLALLPLIGAFVVWAPAAAYLALTGQVVPAAILFVYGAAVVSLSDNYLRPVAGGHEADLNPGLFVVGIFGGVAALGFMGLFYGPLILGVLKALLDVSDQVLGATVADREHAGVGGNRGGGRVLPAGERRGTLPENGGERGSLGESEDEGARIDSGDDESGGGESGDDESGGGEGENRDDGGGDRSDGSDDRNDEVEDGSDERRGRDGARGDDSTGHPG